MAEGTGVVDGGALVPGRGRERRRERFDCGRVSGMDASEVLEVVVLNARDGLHHKSAG